MSRELALIIESLGLVQHAHTDYAMSIGGSANTGWMSITPSAPFEATILYWFTYGDILSRVFRVKTYHLGYTLGTKVVGPDELQFGTACFLYVTDADPFSIYIENLDTVSRMFYGTLWHLNVMTLKQLDLIRVIAWEHAAPGMLKIAHKYGLLPQFPNLPEDMFTDIITL